MKEIFANPDMGLIGLLFFFSVFCAITLWTMRPGGKKTYQDRGNIPFTEHEE